MAPRKHVTVASSPVRQDLLAEFMLTEKQITELRRLPLAEGLFRIGVEREAHVAWARRRADFLANEIRVSRRVEGVIGRTVEFVEPRDPKEIIGGTRLG